MKFLNSGELQKLARSARLQFSTDAEQDVNDKLNAVLEYSGTLMQAVSLHDTIDPQAIRIEQQLVLRPDRVVVPDADALLSRAPEREDRFFVVPVVIAQ